MVHKKWRSLTAPDSRLLITLIPFYSVQTDLATSLGQKFSKSLDLGLFLLQLLSGWDGVRLKGTKTPSKPNKAEKRLTKHKGRERERDTVLCSELYRLSANLLIT